MKLTGSSANYYKQMELISSCVRKLIQCRARPLHSSCRAYGDKRRAHRQQLKEQGTSSDSAPPAEAAMSSVDLKFTRGTKIFLIGDRLGTLEKMSTSVALKDHCYANTFHYTWTVLYQNPKSHSNRKVA